MIEIPKIRLAHPGTRYQGQFLDGLISLFLFILVLYITRWFGLKGLVFDVLIVLIPFAYFVFSDALPGGQSLGKKPFGIYVIARKTGKPCNLWQSFLRNVFSPILGLLDVLLILGADRQRLGDVFAGTAVIKRTQHKS
ncbi:Uncharacterized membrane protein YckC, RDD family [Alteromonadaceae bacterium Bs31]|nr:Uncharacterized membrane protein YckC, RDD family [Alteromonadaceae bacterium Bs31]